jgi:uncharacterized protein (TIGR02646 family)
LIRLKKGEQPEVLIQNAPKWTKELLAEIAKGGDKLAYRKSKYNQPPVKDAIIAETFRKCAYCESQPLHVTYGDIEHVVPKSLEPERTFDWSNLTLACDVCNTKKSDKLGLLDPYDCNPEEEFAFHGPMILHHDGRASAEVTRTILDLNRIDLLNKRKDRLDDIANVFRRIDKHDEADERTLMLQTAIDHHSSQEREFAACSRSFLKASGYDF